MIGEEDSDEYDKLDDQPTWIVDAIDGTTNYVHGLRDFFVSIGFTFNKKVVIGVVYAPLNDDMFHAIHKAGSYLNDIPIQPSGRRDLGQCLIITEWV